jgi:Ni/Fe-hydrogenase subunit HybB-like protein
MYRVDSYMTMYRPAGWTDGVANPSGWDYFPSLGETIVTVGMACVGIALFIVISRLFPVVVVADRAHKQIDAGQIRAATGR